MTYFCAECGEECKPKACDAGIGAYEFWGAKSVDRQPYMGSSCCEGELVDEEGNTVEPELEDPREAEAERQIELQLDEESPRG